MPDHLLRPLEVQKRLREDTYTLKVGKHLF